MNALKDFPVRLHVALLDGDAWMLTVGCWTAHIQMAHLGTRGTFAQLIENAMNTIAERMAEATDPMVWGDWEME